MSEQDHTATKDKRAHEKDRRTSTASKQPSKLSRRKSGASARDSEAAQDEQSTDATAANVEMTSKGISKKKQQTSFAVFIESHRAQSTDTIDGSKLKSSAITLKKPTPCTDVPSQPTASVPIGTSGDSVSAVPAHDAEEAALPAASHVTLVPVPEEQSSAAGPATQQATADEPIASTQVSLTRFSGHASKQAPPKPPEDLKAETEVSGVAADASGLTPAAPIPSDARGCAPKEDEQPACAAAAHVSSAAGAVATVLSPPPAKGILGVGVTCAQNTVLASDTQAVMSPPMPPSTRAVSLRERLRASSISSPISLRLASYDVAAIVRA